MTGLIGAAIAMVGVQAVSSDTPDLGETIVIPDVTPSTGPGEPADPGPDAPSSAVPDRTPAPSEENAPATEKAAPSPSPTEPRAEKKEKKEKKAAAPVTPPRSDDDGGD